MPASRKNPLLHNPIIPWSPKKGRKVFQAQRAISGDETSSHYLQKEKGMGRRVALPVILRPRLIAPWGSAIRWRGLFQHPRTQSTFTIVLDLLLLGGCSAAPTSACLGPPGFLSVQTPGRGHQPGAQEGAQDLRCATLGQAPLLGLGGHSS